MWNAADVISTIASIATVLALVFALWQYRSAISTQKRAYLNAIFDEIKHNLNIRRIEFFPAEEPINYSELTNLLEKLPKVAAYDNPTDSREKKELLYRLLGLNPTNDQLPYRNKYLPIRNNAIRTALGTGLAHKLLPDRIILNLGHLNYGINRDSVRLENFNYMLDSMLPTAGTPVATMGFLSDYLDWVHFRSYFVLIDMVKSFKRNEFVDKIEYDRIRAFV